MEDTLPEHLAKREARGYFFVLAEAGTAEGDVAKQAQEAARLICFCFF